MKLPTTRFYKTYRGQDKEGGLDYVEYGIFTPNNDYFPLTTLFIR